MIRLPLREVAPAHAVAYALLAFVLAGCASMTLEDESIRIVRDANLVSDCLSFGALDSTSGPGGMFAGAGATGLENNTRVLRRLAATRGADTVLIVIEPATFSPYSTAEAFRCR